MMQFNDEQEKVIAEAIDWYNNSSEQVFQISGSAGTGKTTVLKEIINRLKLIPDDVAPMTYTGAAAIVLRTKGFFNSKTIHSWFYRAVEVPDKNRYNAYLDRYETKTVFVPKEIPFNVKLICIDEAGCVPMEMKDVILSSNRKIIALGDLNQLSPVASTAAFLYTGEVHYLSKIMRQNESSGIVYLANEILKGNSLKEGSYGNATVITQQDLTDEMIKNQSDIILCGFNKTREIYNKKCRELNGIDPFQKLPSHGEKIICRKNNWAHEIDGISMANGLCGEVYSYPTMHSLAKRGAAFTIDFKPTMFDMVFKGILCSYKFFNATKDLKDSIRTSPSIKRKFGIIGNLFELGYAITTHLSQGSQYQKGIYIAENFWDKNECKKLDYVGITRFSDNCIFVLRSNKFY